ncbi:MAG: hypothetical protein ACPGTU_09090 [Myxococcota bacterium]
MWLIFAILACGSKAEDSAADGIEEFAWTAGQFNFATTEATDECLGGALEALFMPRGPGTPDNFEYPIYLPSYAELPVSYTVDLRDPFVQMPVTVDSPDERVLQVRGSVMSAVELGRAAYGDCVVTMTVDADILPTSSTEATGNATLAISNPRGDDGRCPVFDDEDCDVKLQLSATRR